MQLRQVKGLTNTIGNCWIKSDDATPDNTLVMEWCRGNKLLLDALKNDKIRKTRTEPQLSSISVSTKVMLLPSLLACATGKEHTSPIWLGSKRSRRAIQFFFPSNGNAYSSKEAIGLYNYMERSNIYNPDIPIWQCYILILLMNILVLPNLPRNSGTYSFNSSFCPITEKQ